MEECELVWEIWKGIDTSEKKEGASSIGCIALWMFSVKMLSLSFAYFVRYLTYNLYKSNQIVFWFLTIQLLQLGKNLIAFRLNLACIRAKFVCILAHSTKWIKKEKENYIHKLARLCYKCGFLLWIALTLTIWNER